MIRSLARKARKNIRIETADFWKIRSMFIGGYRLEQVDAFFASRQNGLVFVMGTGRSGTQLISNLLAANDQAVVFHEPNFFADVGSMVQLRKDPELAVEYWRKFRKFEVYRRWVRYPARKVYAEVNGTIRYQVPGILKEFPDARLYLLSRDGRGVVRSVMGWYQFYGTGSRGSYALAPLENDPYFSYWDKMNRFERICWAWRETNEYLMDRISRQRVVRLEDLVSDYSAMQAMMGDMGLELDIQVWETIVQKPSNNASKNYSFPAWEDWSSSQRRSFHEICGPTMQKLGYEL